MIVSQMMKRIQMQSNLESKSINHSVSPKVAGSPPPDLGQEQVVIKHVSELIDHPNFSKGEPINNLMNEIRKQVKKQTRLTKKENYIIIKELLEFWPLSIVIPSMLILMANIFQW